MRRRIVPVAFGVACLLVGACAGREQAKQDPAAEIGKKIRLAQSYLSAGRTGEALKIVQQAVEMEPSNAELRSYEGQIFYLSGRHAEAEAAYRKALDLDPHLTDAHNNLGLVYDQTGRKDEAEKEFRLALADPAYPTPEKVHFNLGRLYASQGRDDEAIRALRQAVEINPKYYGAHFELASALERAGKTEEAVREYEVAAPEYRNQGDYHYRVGFAYFRLGDRVKAREHLARTLELSPGSESAAKADDLLKVIR